MITFKEAIRGVWHNLFLINPRCSLAIRNLSPKHSHYRVHSPRAAVPHRGGMAGSFPTFSPRAQVPPCPCSSPTRGQGSCLPPGQVLGLFLLYQDDLTGGGEGNQICWVSSTVRDGAACPIPTLTSSKFSPLLNPLLPPAISPSLIARLLGRTWPPSYPPANPRMYCRNS